MKVATLVVFPLIAVLAGCGANPQATAKAAGESATVETARAVAPAPVEIPAGTAVRVRVNQAIDTSRNRAGDRFDATLVSPITHEGRVIVPRGTTFRGHVTTSTPSGRLRHRGYLGLTLDSFNLGGEAYRVSTGNRTMATGSHKKRNAGLIGGGAGLGALIGGLAGGGKGLLIGAGAGAAAGTAGAALTGRKNVHVAAETVMTFTLRSPVRVGTARASNVEPAEAEL